MLETLSCIFYIFEEFSLRMYYTYFRNNTKIIRNLHYSRLHLKVQKNLTVV